MTKRTLEDDIEELARHLSVADGAQRSEAGWLFLRDHRRGLYRRLARAALEWRTVDGRIPAPPSTGMLGARILRAAFVWRDRHEGPRTEPWADAQLELAEAVDEYRTAMAESGYDGGERS